MMQGSSSLSRENNHWIPGKYLIHTIGFEVYKIWNYTLVLVIFGLFICFVCNLLYCKHWLVCRYGAHGGFKFKFLFSCDSSPHMWDVWRLKGHVYLAYSTHEFPLKTALWLQGAPRLANYVTTLQECTVRVEQHQGEFHCCKSQVISKSMYSKDINALDKVGEDVNRHYEAYSTKGDEIRPAASGEWSFTSTYYLKWL